MVMRISARARLIICGTCSSYEGNKAANTATEVSILLAVLALVILLLAGCRSHD